MLPSTGYFKGISCPFYDSGLCERPYCHFRHVKKESQQIANEGIESGAILQKLVSAAVQKVLQQTESPGTSSAQSAAVSDNVIESNKTPTTQSISKVTYNPTPISELNKINSIDSEDVDETNEQKRRHIPVPYTPRKPASLLVKRPVDNVGFKPFIYNPPPIKYTPGSTDPVQPDPYTPKGTAESTEKYLPGIEAEIQEYKPKETQSHNTKHNYIPSDKASKKKILEYKPAKVSSKALSVTYLPTPRSLAPCFSSDEDEPETKKRKLSGDLNGLDELGAEFDILDQILHEEKQNDGKSKSKTDKLLKDQVVSKECKENVKTNSDGSTKENHTVSDKKVYDKEKSESRAKSHKNKHKSKSPDRKSTHKSSREDRHKEEKKEKSSSDKKKHSSSKYSSNDSKPSKDRSSSSSSKKSDKSSKSHKNDTKKGDRKSHRSSKESKDKEKKHIKEKDKHKSKEITVSDSDSNHNADVLEGDQEDEIVLSESDEEAIALECKRIFEEYVPTEKNNVKEIGNKIEECNENEYIPTKKRVSRTADKNIKILPKAPLRPDYKVGAAQTMAERLAKVREFHALKKVENQSLNLATKAELNKTAVGTPNSSSSKIRIAHVPYATTLLNSKKTIPAPSTVASKPVTSGTITTIVQTNKKGAQRVAHMPSEKFIDRPGVLEPLASKIAANVRSTYLNMMIDECLKIYLSAIDAYARAQHEELATSKKCSTVQIYKNSAVLTVSRLRKELQECNGVKKSSSDCSTLQKLPTADGNASNSGSWSIESKNRKGIDNNQFIGAKFYKNIQKWVLTEQELQDNGFPRPHPSSEKGRAMIYAPQKRKQKPPKGFLRTCCRCNKDYTVNKRGIASATEECVYHPNNKYRIRGEVRYQCCSQDGMSDGCCVAPSHVYEYVDYENLRGYIRTMPPDSVKEDYGIYSLDCEMCYTTHGLDLTRITVIDSACKVVYETLIKPLHPIVDYNTRYSGITEEQMSEVQTTLLDVQATLLTMFSSKTILIGHSLESDFKALKLIHDTVIDTSVLYPHKMGPPFKRALRNLSSEYLKKIIQNSVDGHDSAEDASVCMELIQHKLREDLKTR